MTPINSKTPLNFDLKLLGDNPMTKLAEDAVNKIHIDPNVVFAMALGNLAATVGHSIRCVIHEQHPFRPPATLYVMARAKSAAAKSPANNTFLTPTLKALDELYSGSKNILISQIANQEDLIVQLSTDLKAAIAGKPSQPFDDCCDAFESEKDEKTTTVQSAEKLEIKLEEAEEQLKKLKEQLMKPIYSVSDTTPEALPSIMQGQNDKLNLISSEGDCLAVLAGLYSNGQSNLQLVLKSFDGERHEVIRASKPEMSLANPTLSLALMGQPDHVDKLALGNGSFAGRGFIERFSFIWGTSGNFEKRIKGLFAPQNDSDENSLEISKEFQHWISGLLNDSWGRGNNGCIYEVHLTDEARGVLNGHSPYVYEILKKTEETGGSEMFTSYLAKENDRLLRYACLLAVAKAGRLDNVFVDEETAKRAVEISKVFISHTEKWVSSGGIHTKEDKVIRRVARVLLKDDDFLNGKTIKASSKSIDALRSNSVKRSELEAALITMSGTDYELLTMEGSGKKPKLFNLKPGAEKALKKLGEESK
ncbi:YfjI family protein [Dasania sp. GY-MA-18]|uniref:YfjI family protein n=1 Tax=Dasania phycosphaerae TaxID=2950436 RepID=A0A9J6RMS0_9GAMM|nr:MULTISPECIES: YfjI family protein [Dasania]MCR8923185.1 YfjI family protein [Dasania sp. GY-MA-18]MCZ0865617.1 YfjI family protein [Dasania phycosphaerae]MCZ0869342.1 YfjI family protein [Dasania phycosphaerae]